MTDRGSLFTSKFWSSLCYFLGIKWRLSTAFHPQTDGQTGRQNSTIKAYLWAFVNFEQNDWARLLPMAEFAYNNAKNASTGHTPFELNCGYHPRVSYEEDLDPRSKSKSAEEFSAELRDLMAVCRKNLHRAQELQKEAHDKGTKPRSYTPGNKVWLNSKYIKTKRNRKLKSKFFGLFRVLHLVGKQAYKLELPKKWRIHDVFHVSLLEQDTTRKERVDENAATRLEFEAGNNEEYEVATARSMQRNQKGIYQVSTSWSSGKATPRKKTPGNLVPSGPKEASRLNLPARSNCSPSPLGPRDSGWAAFWKQWSHGVTSRWIYYLCTYYRAAEVTRSYYPFHIAQSM